jgi:hypothetical protein
MKNAFDISKKTFYELWLKSSFHHLFLDVVICCCMLHNLILNWRCHARMHGLIHDGRLWACQSCLLRLMYVLRLLYAIRCFRVMVCLGFQLVDDCIKSQALPFSC